MNLFWDGLRFFSQFFIISWGLGFLLSLDMNDKEKIKVPRWLFFLCGAPYYKKSGKPVLTRLGAFLQFFGLFCIILTLLVYWQIPDVNLSRFIVFFSSFLSSSLMVLILRSRTHDLQISE